MQRAALAAVVALVAASAPARAACGAADGIVRVADVDERLDFVLSDGRTLRLGGVAPPDPARAGDLASMARRALASHFVGREFGLERLAGGTDRWGRVIGDLAISASNSAADGGQDSAAAMLLAAGYARVTPTFETRACAPERLRLEDTARRAGLGLWADPRYAVIDSADAEALRKNGGRFVVIEGKVRRVGFGRSRLYFDLVPNDGPTIVVPRKLEPAFARGGHPVDAAAGQTIRARGALDYRLGPRLEVNEPAMIEFLGRPDAPGEMKPHP